jgi:hypothetical protein
MTRRRILASLVSLVAALLPASAARAEVHVDFLFGGGHGHGHGHHHHHHHGWHGGFYWPRPVYYYAPPPVYVPVAQPVPVAVPAVSTYGMAPAAAQPTQAAAAPTPVPSYSTVQSNSLPAYQGRGVSIRNPAETGAAVAFVVDSRREAELTPGESHSLAEKSSYVIEFDRGGNFGTARHVVNEGSYEFIATDRGWDIRRLDTLPTGASNATVRRNTLPTR